MATTIDRNDPEGLMREYVAVCNRAIEANRDSFWLKMETQLTDRLWHGGDFRTIVYDQDPGAVVDEFTLRFDPRAPALKLLPGGEYPVSLTWKTPLSYLEDVVARPQWYVENPLRLDWAWMKQRVRDEAEYRVDGRSLATGIAIGAAGALALAALTRRRGGHELRHR